MSTDLTLEMDNLDRRESVEMLRFLFFLRIEKMFSRLIVRTNLGSMLPEVFIKNLPNTYLFTYCITSKKSCQVVF